MKVCASAMPAFMASSVSAGKVAKSVNWPFFTPVGLGLWFRFLFFLCVWFVCERWIDGKERANANGGRIHNRGLAFRTDAGAVLDELALVALVDLHEGERPVEEVDELQVVPLIILVGWVGVCVDMVWAVEVVINFCHCVLLVDGRCGRL